MSMDILTQGTLFGQPQQRVSQNGKAYCTAKLKAHDGDDLRFVNVIAFNADAVQALSALGDGDVVAVTGPFKASIYTNKQGAACVSLDVTASAVLTAYHVKKRRDRVQGADGNDTPTPPKGHNDRRFEQWDARRLPPDDGDIFGGMQ